MKSEGCVVLLGRDHNLKLKGQQRLSDDRGTRMQAIRRSEYQVKAVAGFEKLWVWQKALKLMQEIHLFCKTMPKDERFRLRDQIERCTSSVCDNIAEGYTSYYYNDKIKGFNIARKEAG